MQRLLALVAAMMMTSLTVASACTAASPDVMNFNLRPATQADRLHVEFRGARSRDNNWSTTFAAADLRGLDLARLRSSGNSPVQFAIVRDAGRVDCAGTGGGSHAQGNCRVTVDPSFLALLRSSGIAVPDDGKAYELIAVDVRRELVRSLAASGYPTPTIGKLIELSAVGVNGRYISDLARAGYRPQTLNSLVEFAALDITPAYIQRFAQLGYGSLNASDLVQFKALSITPDFVAGFERIGYGRLSASDLVQLKALDITPDYVAGFQRIGYRRLPVSKLVEMKALSITPDFMRRMQVDVSPTASSR